MEHEQATRRFYELVWPHRSDVLRVARFLCRDDAASQDLAQETLLKAFRAIDRLTGGPDVKAWLLLILRNTWRDRLRASAARPAEMSLADLDEEPAAVASDASAQQTWGDPEALLESFSDQQMIDALQELPDEIRWTLLLVDVEGMTMQEAAQVLEVPAGTIKSRTFRGRRMFRDRLLPRVTQAKRARDGTSAAESKRPGPQES